MVQAQRRESFPWHACLEQHDGAVTPGQGLGGQEGQLLEAGHPTLLVSGSGILHPIQRQGKSAGAQDCRGTQSSQGNGASSVRQM